METLTPPDAGTEDSRASRWLRKHPDGVGSLVFEVEDIEHTFRLLDGRGGTPITDIVTTTDDFGTYRTFPITTPFGGATFRFVERTKYTSLYPGVARAATPTGGKNVFGFSSLSAQSGSRCVPVSLVVLKYLNSGRLFCEWTCHALYEVRR